MLSSTVAVPSYIPNNSAGEFPLLKCHCSHLFLVFLIMCHLDGCEVVSH